MPPSVLGTAVSRGDSTLGDADIRPALRAHILAKHSGAADTRIIEELGLCRGQTRVDLVVVNGALHGYEIKSERDSLRRLSIQVELYGQVLDRATLVVGDHYLAKSLDLVPEWWGVLRIKPTSKGLQFGTVRRGRKNPFRNPRSLVELLWRDDAIASPESLSGFLVGR